MKQRYDFIAYAKGNKKKVMQNGKFGIIDKDENEIIHTIFDSIRMNPSGSYTVKLDNLYGLYDDKGKVLLSCKYKRLDVDESKNLVWVRNKKDLFGVYDTLGNVICKEESKYLIVCNDCFVLEIDSLYGAKDFKGNTVIPFEYEYISQIGKSSTFFVQKNDLYGIIDKYNNIILPIEFEEIKVLNELIHAVKNNNGKKEHNFYTKGGILVSKCYKDICEILDDGLIIYKENNKYGVMDINGKTILKPEYCYISELTQYDADCSMFLHVEGTKTNEFAVFNKNGKNITGFGCECVKVSHDFGGYIIVARDNKMGVYDFCGNLIVPFDYASIFVFDKHGYAIVQKNGKHGLIDKKGKLLLDPIYDEILSVEDDHATVWCDLTKGIAYYK